MKSIRMGFALIVAANAPLALGSVADGTDCGGFSAAEAAALLKAPATQVTREVAKAGDKWVCSYAVGKSQPAIAFSLQVASSARRATNDLERYRDDLAREADSARWRDKLPNGVYSDMFGCGDEAVWTDITGTYTVRRDNVTVQVTLPKGKDEQMKVGKAIVDQF